MAEKQAKIPSPSNWAVLEMSGRKMRLNITTERIKKTLNVRTFVKHCTHLTHIKEPIHNA